MTQPPSSCLAAMVMVISMPGQTGARRGTTRPMSGTIGIGAVELFVRVAELRSFRAAGDATGVPRSTVSRRIAELEGALGTRLFHRTTRQVELTSAAKTCLRACGPAIGAIVAAGRALVTRPEDTAGRLSVTAPVTLGETLLGEVVGPPVLAVLARESSPRGPASVRWGRVDPPGRMHVPRSLT
jgi:hypothetical protein